MLFTKRYRLEHIEILDALRDTDNLVNSGVKENVDEILKGLKKVSILLEIHLSQEDNVLYPALIRQEGKVQEVAEEFQKEMSGLKKTYLEFSTSWKSSAQINSDPSIFSGEFKGIIEQITYRIEKEENELYPLADELF